MDIGYTSGSAGLLVALVALQQGWGVDFDTAVQRGHAAIAAFAHTGEDWSLPGIVAMMRGLSPAR